MLKVAKTFGHFYMMPRYFAVDFIFVSEVKMAELNKKHRSIDKSTDVLTLPLFDRKFFDKANKKQWKFYKSQGKLFLGDVFICTSVAEKNSVEYGHTKEREICFLALHGLLHILGFDHQSEKEQEYFEVVQRIILQANKVVR